MAASVQRTHFISISAAIFFTIAQLNSQAFAKEDLAKCMQRELASITESPSDYNTERDLGDYRIVLDKTFSSDLASLGPNSLWLDAGGGQGWAAESYLRQYKNRAKVRVVSVERLPQQAKEGRQDLIQFGRYKHLSGRYIEDIPGSELGRPDLITDVMGPLTYSSAPDQVLASYLQILRNDGCVHVHTAENAHYASSYVGNQTFVDWIKSIPNLEVKHTRREEFRIKIKDQTKPIEIPELRLVSIENQIPPVRKFQVTGNKHYVSPRYPDIPEDQIPKSVGALLAEAHSVTGPPDNTVLKSVPFLNHITVDDFLGIIGLPVTSNVKGRAFWELLPRVDNLTLDNVKKIGSAIAGHRGEWPMDYGLAVIDILGPKLSSEDYSTLVGKMANSQAKYSIKIRAQQAWLKEDIKTAEKVDQPVSFGSFEIPGRNLTTTLQALRDALTEKNPSRAFLQVSGKLESISAPEFGLLTRVIPAEDQQELIHKVFPLVGSIPSAEIIKIADNLSPHVREEFLVYAADHLNASSTSELENFTQQTSGLAKAKAKQMRKSNRGSPEKITFDKFDKLIKNASKNRLIDYFNIFMSDLAREMGETVSPPTLRSENRPMFENLVVSKYAQGLGPLTVSDVSRIQAQLEPAERTHFTILVLAQVRNLDESAIETIAAGVPHPSVVKSFARNLLGRSPIDSNKVKF